MTETSDRSTHMEPLSKAQSMEVEARDILTANSSIETGVSSQTTPTQAEYVKPPRATLEQRIKILNVYHRTKMTQAQVVNLFKDQISISGSTFSEWVKREQELRERYADLQARQVAKAREGKNKSSYKYKRMNDIMDRYLLALQAQNQPITENILRQHWQKYAKSLGIADPKRLKSFSNGWLSQFKKRHGLKLKRKNSKTSMEHTSGDSSGSGTLRGVSPSSAISFPAHEFDMLGHNPSFLEIDQQITTEGQNLPRRPASLHLNLLQSCKPPAGMVAQRSDQTPLAGYSSSKHSESSTYSFNPQKGPQRDIRSTICEASLTSSASLLNELEFERFLNKYAHEFLACNSEKYPRSFALFQHLTQLFQHERDMNTDERLKSLFINS
ncbi:HEL270Cp [Eremothecium sinecaudum]|uniref:HEL270Cp n=1 Tax=Eremothecium sinecaudum TaxID=45286 RepID=A0A0X8HSG2_9SACH|nr:HEL270Cp [Eremothecium sinecaudum]AMD21011.1 HEL270Cp [Eremothecium sinecaudum]